jgi:hypothetical protein
LSGPVTVEKLDRHSSDQCLRWLQFLPFLSLFSQVNCDLVDFFVSASISDRRSTVDKKVYPGRFCRPRFQQLLEFFSAVARACQARARFHGLLPAGSHASPQCLTIQPSLRPVSVSLPLLPLVSRLSLCLSTSPFRSPTSLWDRPASSTFRVSLILSSFLSGSLGGLSIEACRSGDTPAGSILLLHYRGRDFGMATECRVFTRSMTGGSWLEEKPTKDGYWGKVHFPRS